jgi:hypothetical protein
MTTLRAILQLVSFHLWLFGLQLLLFLVLGGVSGLCNYLYK